MDGAVPQAASNRRAIPLLEQTMLTKDSRNQHNKNHNNQGVPGLDTIFSARKFRYFSRFLKDILTKSHTEKLETKEKPLEICRFRSHCRGQTCPGSKSVLSTNLNRGMTSLNHISVDSEVLGQQGYRLCAKLLWVVYPIVVDLITYLVQKSCWCVSVTVTVANWI